MANILLFTIFPPFPNRHSETLQFSTDLGAKSLFIQSLILYDKVVIPSQSMSELLVLGEWFGFDFLFDLIDNGNIAFVQQEGRIVYSGEHQDLIVIRLERPEWPMDASRYFAAAAMCQPAEAAEIILQYGALTVDRRQIKQIANAMAKHAVKLPHQPLTDAIDQTKRDLMENDGLSIALSLKGSDISRMKGIARNQMRVGFSVETQGQSDQLTNLLRLAFLNCILEWGSKCEANNFHLPMFYDDLVFLKNSHIMESRQIGSGIDKILLHRNLPDFQGMVLNQSIDSSVLMKLLHDESISELRRWVHSQNVEFPDDYVKAYTAQIAKYVPQNDGLGKLVKLTLTTFVGMQSPELGVAMSLIDIFLCKSASRKYPIKYFFDKIESFSHE